MVYDGHLASMNDSVTRLNHEEGGPAGARDERRAEGGRMAAIISIGFKTEAFVSGGGAIPAFSHEPAANDFERLLDTVRGAIGQSGHVIAIYPDYAAEPSLARLETVSTALNTNRLATYGTKLPPLAGAALTALAAAVTAYVKAPGVLLAALPSLEKSCWCSRGWGACRSWTGPLRAWPSMSRRYGRQAPSASRSGPSRRSRLFARRTGRYPYPRPSGR